MFHFLLGHNVKFQSFFKIKFKISKFLYVTFCEDCYREFLEKVWLKKKHKVWDSIKPIL